MKERNKFIKRFESVDELKKHFEEKGIIAEVIDTPCGPAFVGGYSPEEFDRDRTLVEEISQHYDSPMSLYNHLKTLKSLKDAGKDDYRTVYDSHGYQFLLSVKEQCLRNMEGDIVSKNTLSVELNEEDLLRLWNLRK